MARNRLLKGKETVVYVDGSEVEINFYSVSSFERTNLRRIHRETSIDKKGNLTKADFNDDEFMAAMLKKSVGNQMSVDDIKEIDYIKTEEGNKDALKYLFDKYFGELSKAKKEQ